VRRQLFELRLFDEGEYSVEPVLELVKRIRVNEHRVRVEL
jgi:hypothetical protein